MVNLSYSWQSFDSYQLFIHIYLYIVFKLATENRSQFVAVRVSAICKWRAGNKLCELLERANVELTLNSLQSTRILRRAFSNISWLLQRLDRVQLTDMLHRFRKLSATAVEIRLWMFPVCELTGTDDLNRGHSLILKRYSLLWIQRWE